MHIGFLTTEYVTEQQNSGGIANYLKKVATHLAARGHNISVFCIASQNRTWQDGAGVRVHEVKVRKMRLGRLSPFSPLVNGYLRSRALRRRVRQVHHLAPLNVLQSPSYMYPGLAFLKMRVIPLVCRVSSYAPLLLAARGLQRTVGTDIDSFLEVRQVQQANVAFCPSAFLQNVYARFEGIRPEVVRTPLDLANRREIDGAVYEAKLKGKTYLLFFGTLNRIKGVDLLAEALPPILIAHPNLHMVLVGPDHGMPGTPLLVDHMKTLNAPHASRIHHLGVLPKSLLYGVLQKAHTVVMPSRVDNMPNACLEAQQFSKPVVGTYDSSLEELIEDGRTGFLARNSNASSLRDAIERSLRLDEAQLAAMEVNIQADVQRAEQEDRISRLLEIYNLARERFNGHSVS